MVDYLQRFNQHVGLMQRLREAAQAEKEGRVLGLQYGDIPVLGGLLRPAGATLNAAGLGLEAMGTAGSAIAGTAAIPAIYGQAAGGREGDPLTEYSQQIAGRGLGDLLTHPGRNISQLRTSPDSLTSWLAGILEMASDPTNLLLAPASGYMKAGKAINAARRAEAGASFSDDFVAGLRQSIDDDAAKVAKGEADRALAQQNSEDAFNRFQQFLDQEMIRRAGYEGGRQRVDGLNDQLAQAKAKTGSTLNVLEQARADWNAAEKLGDEKIKEARKAGGYFEKLPKKDDPLRGDVEAFNKEMRAEIRGGVMDELGIARDFKEYTKDPYIAWKAAQDEEDQILALYRAAVKQVPKRQFRDKGGKVISGKEAKALFGQQPNVNEVFNSDPTLAGMVNVDDPATALDADALIRASAPDSPDAIVAQAGRVANAQPLGPLHGPDVPKSLVIEKTDPFPTRTKSMISTAFADSLETQKAAQRAVSGGFRLGFRDIISAWKGINVQTGRNAIMDDGFSRAILADAGIRRQVIDGNKSWLIRRVQEMGPDAQGLYEHPLAHVGTISDVLSAQGVLNRLSQKDYTEAVRRLGVNPLEMETKNVRDLNALEAMAANAIVGMANPVRASVNALFLPLGWLAPMRRRMFHIVNNITHLSSRGAAFEQAYIPYVENSARSLLAAAADEGKDVSRLAGRNVFRDGAEIMQEGVFSPEEATLLLGERYGNEWRRMLSEAVEAGYRNADDVLGNYADRGPLERTIDTFFPFMSWTWRAYRRVARLALSHPVMTAGLLQLWEADAKAAEAEGRPAYQVPTLEINRETPLVGVLARVFSPEQEAELRVNPLSFLMPFSGQNTEVFSENSNMDTNYQKIMGIAGAVGMNPSPIVQTAAYVHGDDFQAPGPGSRYAPLDQLPDEFGVNLELPSLAHGTLRAARKAVSGKEDTYDPVVNKAKELIFERTGKPASDRSNVLLAVQLQQPNSPLMRLAERVLDTSGSTRAAFNAFSPTNVMVNTESQVERRKARLGIPFTYKEVKAMEEVAPQLALLMDQANKQYKAQNPAAAIQDKPRVLPRDLAIARGAEKRRLLRELYGVQ